ncbi:MAG TPA: glycosyltransferase family 39 protein [Ignavibacteria bacterium]|mgnify:CR=1 FL=1|nr:glycosyltransferase family 39 protein [Ignavibacteria bacterium]HMR41453.1 glycosyltransferase family 39 protein [Ignavibacteria bacterium]
MKIFPEDYRKYKILILVLSSVPFLIHLYTNLFAGYGYFRDELYYIACGNHLSFGYVDHPPLSIFILKLSTLIFGDSVFAIRLIPAVNSALIVFMTCLITLRLGGKKTAVIISSVCVIFAPVYLAMSGFYSMNSFDILLWSIAFYYIILIIENNDTGDWIILGIVMGLGLLNKISFLWLGAGLFAGILFTDKRKVLLTAKPYICALLALLIFSPYIIWNFQNDFAHLEFIRNAGSDKYSGLNVASFIKGQLMNMNPASLIVWIPGLFYFLFDKSGKKYKIPAIIFITVFLILVINEHSKAEYLSPAFIVLFSGGGVLIERLTSVNYRWLRYAVIIPVVFIGIFAAPLAIPVLPVESYISYAGRYGFGPSSSEGKELNELPQHFADMFGWEELASDVSVAYMTLSPDAQKRAVVFCNNYGEASAINFFSKEYKLPEAISGHNSYWLWGFKKTDDPVVILIGGNKQELLKIFDYVDEVLVHNVKYAMPYENNLPIFIARKIKSPLDSVWSRNKHYD